MNNTNDNTNTQPTAIPVSGGNKEHAPIAGSKIESVQNASEEMELPKELKEIGVEQISGSIELPPDLKKLGVTQTSSTQVSIQPSSNLPQVTLPISDSTVMQGLHASVSSALLWLATWCIKKLKKTHILLKSAGGKVIRVKES